ncbi:putative alpha/beta hydrolase protein [Lepidopterella palustris CBS 459.81]|uniref:Putative alpha/beta hydrolase protein n=1 Tax=Lepidopterella palustris CBS 459.81 TaxID=1314670 RepID=A0A8E2E5S3_9PEZI|nr:putative alpha/beta hydrolase protein [Lepidopterella palustris CBS 459.81]
MSPKVTHSTLPLPTGEKIFYRTAGPLNAPTILLLHGYPSSSYQYRNLIPLLAPHYRVIAPDLPAFGFTSVPSTYTYTFAALTTTIATFLETVPSPPEKYTVYIFDYGAPIGLRLALANPAAVSAIITQSGNAYADGLSAFWDPLKKLWIDDTPANRDALRPFLTLDGTKSQYTTGTRDLSLLDPASYYLDQALLDRPGNKEIQLDLFADYGSNVTLYPAFQAYFRASRVPLLAVWGKNDAIFTPEGAEAFRRDLPNARILLLDAGHFAVETETEEIAERMLEFLKENGI